MENIVIVGAGGFGREVQWLIERINQVEEKFNILGFIDDGIEKNTAIGDLTVLGGCEYLQEYEGGLNVAVAIGSAKIRKIVVEKIIQNKNLVFPNLVDPSVLTSARVQLGQGNIICAGTILTVDYILNDFNIINLDCTVGHDVDMGSYITVYPSVNISGCVKIGDVSEIGTGTNIIQGISIGKETIIGAGSVVIRDIEGSCTAVGNPCKVIKWENRVL